MSMSPMNPSYIGLWSIVRFTYQRRTVGAATRAATSARTTNTTNAPAPRRHQRRAVFFFSDSCLASESATANGIGCKPRTAAGVGRVRMPPIMTLLRCCLAIVLMTSLSFAQTQPAGADALISDFEGKLSLLPSKATAEIGPGDAAQGVKFLRLKPHTPEAGKAYLKLPLPDDVALFPHERLTAQLRVPATQPISSTQPAPRQQIRLSWMALNAQNPPIFQRQLLLEPNDKWVKLESPLRTWLWDQRRVGDWDEVESLVLRIDSADVAHVDVDDVRLEGLAKPGAQTEWLLDLAFGAGAPRKVASGDGLMVATDAVDAFSAEDLERLLDDMRRTRAFVRRVFGDAVRPTDDIGVPASLLIFEDEARQAAF